MKKIQLNATQLSQILNVSPQAVGAFARKGQLIRNDDGLFDLSDSVNKSFLKNRNIDIKKISVLPDQARLGRPPIPRLQGQIKSIKPETNVSTAELQRDHLKKKIEKLDIEIDAKHKRLFPAEFCEDVLFKYIETMNSNIERLFGTYIQDVGKKILEAGEVLPEHITEFTNLGLQICHDTKQKMQVAIKNFDPAKPGK